MPGLLSNGFGTDMTAKARLWPGLIHFSGESSQNLMRCSVLVRQSISNEAAAGAAGGGEGAGRVRRRRRGGTDSLEGAVDGVSAAELSSALFVLLVDGTFLFSFGRFLFFF